MKNRWVSAVYPLLALAYVISVVALCYRAPVEQRPVELLPNEVDEAPSPSGAPHFLHWDDEAANRRMPLWGIIPDYSLRTVEFVVEQAELLGTGIVLVLALRFRVQVARRGITFAGFLCSRRRGTCIWFSFVILFALSLFPPWVRINTFGGKYPTQRQKLWHAPVFRAPLEATRWESADVDYPRMLTDLIAGESFVLALYLTWGRKKQSAGQ